MNRETIATDRAPQAIGPYSQAIRVGETIYCSGQIPLTPQGELLTGGIEAQTEQVLKNLQAVLEAAGASLADVVKTTVYLADMNDYARVNEVYARFFSGSRPARAAVEVARLPKDVGVEIECIAVRGA